MGNLYDKPPKQGDSPYTRTGLPPPTLTKKADKPRHIANEPMSLELHMADEAHRIVGLSPAEREWRAKWVKDQHLHPDEPIEVDAVYRQLNPIRILYRLPMDKLYVHLLKPTFGQYYGTALRVLAPKFLMGVLFIEFGFYYWKYERKDWYRAAGVSPTYIPRRNIDNREEIEANHPGLIDMALEDPEKNRYFSPLFVKRTSHIDVGEPSRPW